MLKSLKIISITRFIMQSSWTRFT